MNCYRLTFTLFLLTASSMVYSQESQGITGNIVKVEQYYAKSKDGTVFLKTPLQVDRTLVVHQKFKDVAEIYEAAIDTAKSGEFIRFETVRFKPAVVDTINKNTNSNYDPNNTGVRAFIVTSYEWELENGIVRNSKGSVTAHSRKATPATGNQKKFRNGKTYDGTSESLSQNLFSAAKDGSVTAAQAQEIAQTTGSFRGAISADPNAEIKVDPAPEDEKAPSDISAHTKAYEVLSWGCGGIMTWDCDWGTEGRFTSLKEAQLRLADVKAENKLIRTMYVKTANLKIMSDWKILDRTYQTFFIP